MLLLMFKLAVTVHFCFIEKALREALLLQLGVFQVFADKKFILQDFERYP